MWWEIYFSSVRTNKSCRLYFTSNSEWTFVGVTLVPFYC